MSREKTPQLFLSLNRTTQKIPQGYQINWENMFIVCRRSSLFAKNQNQNAKVRENHNRFNFLLPFEEINICYKNYITEDVGFNVFQQFCKFLLVDF